MIKIKVKTLNGTDTSFEVSENITIKEFKEHVATSINIPAPNQRIIYHGRVLLDDKVLSSLNLNEQTLHIVERSPGQSEQLPQNNVLPSRQPVTEISEQQIAIGNVFVSVADMEQDAIIDSMRRLVERWSDGEGRPTMRVSRQTPDRNLEILLIMQETEIDSPAYARLRHIENCLTKIEQALHHLEDGPLSTTELMSDRRTTSVSSDSSSTIHFEEPRRNGESSRDERPPLPRVNIREASSAFFASVFEHVQATQRRLQPFLDWYFNILQNEPTYSADAQQQAQRDTERFERFQSIMHHMGHVYHCLSDLYVPFATQSPPRIVEPRANRTPTTRLRPPELHIIMQFVRSNDEPPLTPQSAPAISTTGGFTLTPTPATFASPNPFLSSFRLGGVPTTAAATVGGVAVSAGTGGFRMPGVAAAVPTTTTNVPPSILGGLRLGSAPLMFGATALRAPSSGAGAIRPPTTRPAAFWPLGGFMDSILGRQATAATSTPGVRATTANQHATEQARTARIPTQFTAGSANGDIPPFLQSFINHFTSALANGADQAEHGDGDGEGGTGGEFFITGESVPVSAMHGMDGDGHGPGATTTTSSLHGGLGLGAGRLVDSFLPCSSRHFAQQPPPEMLASRRRRRQNADPTASVPSVERAPEVLDAQEFEDAMENALRSVIHNLRAQRSSPASAITVHTVTGSFPADEQHSANPQQAAATENSASRESYTPPSSQMTQAAATQSSTSCTAQTKNTTNMNKNEQPESSHIPIASGQNGSSSSVPPKSETSQLHLQDGWKSQVPRDWVPIIEADIERQRTEPAAKLTFSDAYTNGMSSKRKRMGTELTTPELPVKCMELGEHASTCDVVEGENTIAEGGGPAMSSASSSSRGFLRSPPEKRFSGETSKNGPDPDSRISSQKEHNDDDSAKKVAKN